MNRTYIAMAGRGHRQAHFDSPEYGCTNLARHEGTERIERNVPAAQSARQSENVRIDRCRDRDRACLVVLKANAPLETQLWIRPVREFRKPSGDLLWASKEPTRGDVSVMRSLATIERHRRRLPCPLALKCARPGRLPDARNVLDFNDHQASYHATNSQCGLLTCPSASTLLWL